MALACEARQGDTVNMSPRSWRRPGGPLPLTPSAPWPASQRSGLRRRWWLAFIAVTAALILPGLIELIRLSIAQHRLDRRLAQLRAQEQRLLAQQDRLQHDPVYVEGLIRTTFKHAKPGELVIPLKDQRE